MNDSPQKCLLCGTVETEFYHEDDVRRYFQCYRCGLVFVLPAYWLSRKEERQRYDLHENDPADEGYRKFLSRLVKPLIKRIPPKSRGLDFGSGPGPALVRMFEERGYSMRFYDIFYAPDYTVFQQQYDFITATEVVEHLHDPRKELERLWSCLKPGGYLGIMTKRVKGREAFADWHYIRDKTHVAFFSRQTFSWLADWWNAGVKFIGNDVIIFAKGEERGGA